MGRCRTLNYGSDHPDSELIFWQEQPDATFIVLQDLPAVVKGESFPQPQPPEMPIESLQLIIVGWETGFSNLSDQLRQKDCRATSRRNRPVKGHLCEGEGLNSGGASKSVCGHPQLLLNGQRCWT